MNPDCSHGGLANCAQCDAFVAEAQSAELSEMHLAVLCNAAGGWPILTSLPRRFALHIPGLSDPPLEDPFLCNQQLLIKGLIEYDGPRSARCSSGPIYRTTPAGDEVVSAHGLIVQRSTLWEDEIELPLPGMIAPPVAEPRQLTE